MPIKSVDCQDTTRLVKWFFDKRMYTCKEIHDDGKTSSKIHNGGKDTIKDQIKTYYGDDVYIKGL